MKRNYWVIALAVAGCSGHVGQSSSPELADVVFTAATIPSDGQCTHIVVTRLADFQVTEYRGLLAGATIKAPLGEDRVTATAYPSPCASEPPSAPWAADAQTATFVQGANRIALAFHENVNVGIDPSFDDTNPLVIRAGSQTRISRNGEDTAGPSFALDGWEVKQLTLPPAAVSEKVLFSLDGKGLPYSPRGMAHLPDGSFVFQVSETSASLYLFNAMGAPLGTWPVSYPAGTTKWDVTDGLEAIDATHLVRTGWLNTGIGCDASGNHCKQSGIEVLTKMTAADGSTFAQVTSQIFLPELPTAALNAAYPVGVAPVGAKFAVSVLPDTGTTLVLLNADGTVAAGPVVVPNSDIEGLFDDGAGKLVGLDYHGTLSEYNDSNLSVLPGTGNLGEGVGLMATRLAWRSAGAGSLVASDGVKGLVYATPDFASTTNVGLDTSGFNNIAGLDYKPATDELVVMDRFPNSGVPTVVTFNLTTKLQTSSVTLQPGMGKVRGWSLAYVASTQQIVANFRRPGGNADTTLDAVAFVHNADGTLASKLDLTPLGFKRIDSIRYDAANDQLLFITEDGGGVTRIVTTDRAGKPKRSYRTDALPGLADLTAMANGPFAGDYGVVQAQPSFYARVALP